MLSLNRFPTCDRNCCLVSEPALCRHHSRACFATVAGSEDHLFIRPQKGHSNRLSLVSGVSKTLTELAAIEEMCIFEQWDRFRATIQASGYSVDQPLPVYFALFEIVESGNDSSQICGPDFGL